MTDTIEAVAEALEEFFCASDRAHGTPRKAAQAAYATVTKALIEQAGELEQRLLDTTVTGFGLTVAAVDAAATIAALRAENERAKAGDEAYILPCDVKLPPATTIKAGCTLKTLKLALELEGRPSEFTAISIARAKEEGVRAGIEAAYDAARGTNADMHRNASEAYIAMLTAIRAAAIARGDASPISPTTPTTTLADSDGDDGA